MSGVVCPGCGQLSSGLVGGLCEWCNRMTGPSHDALHAARLSVGARVRLTRPWLGVPTGSEGVVVDELGGAVRVRWDELPERQSHLTGCEDQFNAAEAARFLEVL